MTSHISLWRKLLVCDVVIVVSYSVTSFIKTWRCCDVTGRTSRADCGSHSADFSSREEIPILLQTFQHVLTCFVAVKHWLDRSANLKFVHAFNDVTHVFNDVTHVNTSNNISYASVQWWYCLVLAPPPPSRGKRDIFNFGWPLAPFCVI